MYNTYYLENKNMGKFKTYLKNLAKAFKGILTGIKDIQKSIFCFCLALLGSVLLLVSGALNSDTHVYKSAQYFASLIGSNNIKHVGVVVEQMGATEMPDTATELRSLYGAFGNRESNYAGTINASKEKSITFTDLDDDSNLSFVYIQSGEQVSKSKVDDRYYRPEFYPLDLMFEHYAHNPYQFYSFTYISTSHARMIIDKTNPGLFDPTKTIDELLENPLFIEKCKELIGTGIGIDFDEFHTEYQITNIYYEHDYFYNIVHETMGEFLVGYRYYPDGFNKQATYFLNEYEYQNNFYLNYIRVRYDTSNYKYSLATADKNINFNLDFAFQFQRSYSNVSYALILIVAIAFFAIYLVIMFLNRLYNLSFSFYSLLSIVIPYALGFIIYKITGNIIYFSPSFTTAFLITMLVTVLLFIILFFIKKNAVVKEIKDD